MNEFLLKIWVFLKMLASYRHAKKHNNVHQKSIKSDEDIIEIDMIDYDSPEYKGIIDIDTIGLRMSIKMQDLLRGTVYNEFVYNEGQKSFPFYIKLDRKHEFPIHINYVATYADGTVLSKKFDSGNIYFQIDAVSKSKCLLEKVQLAFSINDSEDHVVTLFADYDYDLNSIMNRMDDIELLDQKGNSIKSFDGFIINHLDLVNVNTILAKFTPIAGEYIVKTYKDNMLLYTAKEQLSNSSDGVNIPINTSTTHIVIYKIGKDIYDAQLIKIV